MIADPSRRCRTFAAATCLSAQRPQCVDLRQKRSARSLERLDRERTGDVGCPGQASRPYEAESERRSHELGAVDERQPFLRLELNGLELGPRERVRSREPLAVEPRLSLADEREREMGERREIARRSHRAAAGYDRQDSAVEKRQEQLDRLDAGTGVALRERVRAQEHRRPDDLVGIRIADSARVRAQQPQLQLRGLLLGDRNGDEAAEAGVDAVGVLAAPVRGSLHKLAGGVHSFPRQVGELHRRPVDGHGPDVVDGQVVAGEADRRPLRHDASLGRQSPGTFTYVPPGGLATPCRHRIGVITGTGV